MKSKKSPSQAPLPLASLPPGTVALIIPAVNEARVLGTLLAHLTTFVSPKDIYVVDDGSRDRTSVIARRYTSHVLTLPRNQGKAQAMHQVVDHFRLTRRYRFLMPLDADTYPQPDFFRHTLPLLRADKHHQIACVIGQVTGNSYNWLTSYRLWEYQISQSIHKSAQNCLGSITVCPGCATIYRSKIFNRIPFPTGTLTEDMDLTFAIHRRGLGRLVYCPQAIVITQDPQTLSDFLGQADRWYTGFWQCLIKHHIPWGGQRLDAEVALLATEGLFNGLFVTTFVGLAPFLLFAHPFILAVPFGLDLFFFLLPTMAFTAFRQRTLKIFKYLPHFYLLRFISSLIFIKSFVKIVLGLDFTMSWFKTHRYRLILSRLWTSHSKSPHHTKPPG
jgi:cellulose synthase/poly-beta-1,6-N-acetylglucosamine synthase-like glycosyltransferase